MIMTMPQEEQYQQNAFIPQKYIIIGVLAAIIIGMLGVVLAWLISRYGNVQLDVIRDLFIIGLALEGCIFGIALIILIIMVIRLINTIEFEVKPILEKASQLVGTAKGTTDFVSENVVRPTMDARKRVNGVRAGAKALLRDPKKNLPK